MTRRQLMLGAMAAATAQAAGSKPVVCFFSKHLQDFNYDQLGKALHDAGFGGVDLTVRPGGHVLPERAAEDLPRAFETLQSHGVQVPMISTGLVSATDPAARSILQTAARLGIPCFKLGYYTWGKDLGGTLAEVKASLQGLVELAKEYGITAGLHNHVGYVGQAIWDVNPLLAEMDPKRLGYYYDFDHATVLGARDTWQITLRLASPRLKMVAMKDFNWVKSAAGWQTEACPLGQGAVNWEKAFAALAEYKYSGPISIHQEYKSADRLASARRDLEFVMRHL